MDAMTYTTVRENLASAMDRVCNDHEAVTTNITWYIGSKVRDSLLLNCAFIIKTANVTRPLATPCRFDCCDVDLSHFHHGLERAFGCGGIRVDDCRNERARRDLPRQAPLVLAPAAGAFVAAVSDDRVPQAVGFSLVIGCNLERKGFVVLERRASVQADTGNADHAELDRQNVAFLA